MHIKSRITKILIAAFATIMLLNFIAACDDFKSQEFQIEGVDAAACNQLSDTLFSTLTLKRLSTFRPGWNNENALDSVTAILDSLEANGIMLNVDGSGAVEIATTASDTGWFALRSDFSTIAVYMTETAVMNLISPSGTLQKTSDKTMPFEIAGGCTVLENDKPVPLIRERFKYSITEDRYLVQLIKGEQTRSNRIKVSALRNQ